MNKLFILIGILILVALGAFVYSGAKKTPVLGEQIATFDACVAAGYPVMESYPAQCKTPDGTTFIQDIGNETMMTDVIRIKTPRPHMTIQSPIRISGEARGTWYFEASFPVKLLDANDTVLAQVPAQAQDEWMTKEFVPFEAKLLFTTPQTKTGTLVLEKDNPSGLPEYSAQLRVPIRFTNE